MSKRTCERYRRGASLPLCYVCHSSPSLILSHFTPHPPTIHGQAAEGGEEDPEIIAVYDSVCKDLDEAVTSGALDEVRP